MEHVLKNRIDGIRSELFSAAEKKWGNVPEIIAVSKNVEPARINGLLGTGVEHLGENRVQEILKKLPYLDASFRIDFIGRLQINKVKYIIDKVAMIQSLDRIELAKEIDLRASKKGLRMPVLIQVNIGRESQKGGIAPEEVLSFARIAASFDALEVRGLMAVMPDIDDEEQLRPYFRHMRGLFDMLQNESIAETRIEMLSMGMSGDYLLAAQEGATHVRIGSAIFGERSVYNDALQKENTLKGETHR